MRINQFVARASGLSRRTADKIIAGGRVTVNNQTASLGQNIFPGDVIKLDDKALISTNKTVTIMLNKPAGYVVSRRGQGSRTIYELLPAELHSLKPIGRLDKESSGLLLLTSDGRLAQQLTHPKFGKQKIYKVELDKPLAAVDKSKVEQGVKLKDGLSLFKLEGRGITWTIKMSEGRNRQIRRTFNALGYSVTKLHRIKFGHYELSELSSAHWINV